MRTRVPGSTKSSAVLVKHDGAHQDQRLASFAVGTEPRQCLAQIRLALFLRLERDLLSMECRLDQGGRIGKDSRAER
jgi:hypothetical protein